jgi:hypothetical protein
MTSCLKSLNGHEYLNCCTYTVVPTHHRKYKTQEFFGKWMFGKMFLLITNWVRRRIQRSGISLPPNSAPEAPRKFNLVRWHKNYCQGSTAIMQPSRCDKPILFKRINQRRWTLSICHLYDAMSINMPPAPLKIRVSTHSRQQCNRRQGPKTKQWQTRVTNLYEFS